MISISGTIPGLFAIATAPSPKLGIKRVARPHHYVEPDVHEYVHMAKLNKQSPGIGWVQNVMTIH